MQAPQFLLQILSLGVHSMWRVIVLSLLPYTTSHIPSKYYRVASFQTTETRSSRGQAPNWYRLEHIRCPQVQALYSDTDTHSLSSSISSPFRIGSVFWHLSSTAQLHSSVQTRWHRLQEHLREHLLVVSTLVDPQLHRMSWRTAPGAGVSFVSNDRSLTYCIWHLSVTESGTTEFTIRSWDQTLHWTCARRMCSNQAIWVVGSLSTPWSGFSCLKRCHPTAFAWDVWSCSGQKTEHKNSSDPLNTWTDGYAILQAQ